MRGAVRKYDNGMTVRRPFSAEAVMQGVRGCWEEGMWNVRQRRERRRRSVDAYIGCGG